MTCWIKAVMLVLAMLQAFVIGSLHSFGFVY